MPLFRERNVSEIMLNYASALDSIWPYTSNVGLICYDPWEEFNDSLFRHLVVKTLAYKYNLNFEEVGLESLAYPWKNQSEIRIIYNNDTFKFRQFGYPGIDLVGDEEQYFGENGILNNPSEMKFSHALCESEHGMEWFERDALVYQYKQKT